MAYTDTIEGGGRRRAVAGVALVHVALGYALIVGLAASFDRTEPDEGFAGFDVPIPTPTIVPPPPMPEPTASERAQPSDSIITVPEPSDAPLPPSGPPIGTFDGPVFDGPIGLPTGTGTGDGPIVKPRPSPSPTASVTPAPPPDTPARALGRASSWIGTADYRPSWIRRGLEGTVGFALAIGANGRVESCAVTASSGHAALDRATCDLVTKRARFEPAVSGRTGKPVAGAYRGRVQWVVPE